MMMPSNETETKVETTPTDILPRAMAPTFSMPRMERVEKVLKLRELSKEIFGSYGKWRKILDNGMPTAETITTVETVPGENGAPDTTREVKVAKEVNGIRQVYVKRFTLDTLMDYMLEMKAKRDEFMAQIKKLQEEQAAKAAAEKARLEALDEARGSALK